MDSWLQFQINLRALKIVGIFIPIHTWEKPSKLLQTWKFLGIFLYIVLHLLVIANLLLESKTLGIFSRLMSSYNIFVCTIILLKIVYFSMNSMRIRKLITLIDEVTAGRTNGWRLRGLSLREDLYMRRKSARNCRFISMYIFLVTIGAIFVFIGTVMLFRTITIVLDWSKPVNENKQIIRKFRRVTLYHMWWPNKIMELPTYYFILLWQFFCSMISLTVSCTTDALTCALMLAASERADMLAKTAPRALVPTANRNTLAPAFRAWIRTHQRYLKMMECLMQVIGPMVFISHTMAFVTFIIISLGVFKASSNSIGDSIMVATMLTITVRGLIQLTFMSYSGQKIIDSSARLSRSVVNAAQVQRGLLSRGPNRSALQVLVTRMSVLGDRYAQVSGLGFFTVSMEFFSSVISGSLSYLLVLLQFKSIVSTI
ncbi:Odorant receptor 43 [Ephemera danica]|nr:Odorant receptor 43 [Ephemera danica]